MKYAIAVLALIYNLQLIAQVHPASMIKDFYRDLNSGDSAKIRSYFFDDAVIQHLDKDTSYEFSIDGFMGVAPKFKSKMYQEEVLHIDMTLPPSYLAYTVVADFKFFFREKEHHCGQDIFFIQVGEDFQTPKIIRVVSTEGDCWEESEYQKEIQRMLEREKDNAIAHCEAEMDHWHVNAADANFEKYFEVMADSFYYLGTDPNERWSKTEFAEFCKPYFDRGTTWEFEAERRNWDISDDGNVAWFDEYLFTTNMDYCRGSGVWQKVDGEWKIFHYNLTVLIENEKMKQFLKLRKK